MQFTLNIHDDALVEWIEADVARATNAMVIGHSIIASGVNVAYVAGTATAFDSDSDLPSSDDDRRSLAESLSTRRRKFQMSASVTQAWPTCEIKIVDLQTHVILDNGDRIVFVVMTKDIISGDDVRKAVADVDVYRREYDDFRALIFISVGTRNIPMKGALKVEMIGSTTVGWIGLDVANSQWGSGAGSAELTQFLIVFRSVIGVNAGGAGGGSGASQKMIAAIGMSLRDIDEQKAIIARLESSIAELRVNVVGAYDRLAAQIAVADPSRPVAEAPKPSTPVESVAAVVYTCPRCQKTYKHQGYYTKHIDTCK